MNRTATSYIKSSFTAVTCIVSFFRVWGIPYMYAPFPQKAFTNVSIYTCSPVIMKTFKCLYDFRPKYFDIKTYLRMSKISARIQHMEYAEELLNEMKNVSCSFSPFSFIHFSRYERDRSIFP